MEKIKKIIVDGFPIGIRGLDDALEAVAKKFPNGPDERVKEELLKILSLKNYIPESAVDRYKEAFLREFKKFTG